ncbi:MAG: hypothetical protein ACE5Z5_14615 [Candidatus Bathyarchaeia archaeon]
MVVLIVLNQNLDKNNKVYIRRGLREAGFTGTVTILWCNNAAVMHPCNARLWEVKASLELILRDMELQLKAQEDETSRG